MPRARPGSVSPPCPRAGPGVAGSLSGLALPPVPSRRPFRFPFPPVRPALPRIMARVAAPMQVPTGGECIVAGQTAVSRRGTPSESGPAGGGIRKACLWIGWVCHAFLGAVTGEFHAGASLSSGTFGGRLGSQTGACVRHPCAFLSLLRADSRPESCVPPACHLGGIVGSPSPTAGCAPSDGGLTGPWWPRPGDCVWDRRSRTRLRWLPRRVRCGQPSQHTKGPYVGFPVKSSDSLFPVAATTTYQSPL